MYDVKPGHESVPELAEHMAQRRQKTLDAIKQGVCYCEQSAGHHGCDMIAQRVLISLEAMWRNEEVFS